MKQAYSIIIIVYRCLQIHPNAWDRMTVSHCSITTLTIKRNGEVTLRQLNVTDHL